MRYTDGVPMDDDMRVLYCPRCQNEELDNDSEFCQICGLSLYNTCTGDWQSNIPEHRNKSNARFCKICGLPTTFFQENLLQPYTEVIKQGFVNEPQLHQLDTDYDRYIEMSIVTGDSLLTAADAQEFGEIIDTGDELPIGSDVPF